MLAATTPGSIPTMCTQRVCAVADPQSGAAATRSRRSASTRYSPHHFGRPQSPSSRRGHPGAAMVLHAARHGRAVGREFAPMKGKR